MDVRSERALVIGQALSLGDFSQWYNDAACKPRVIEGAVDLAFEVPHHCVDELRTKALVHWLLIVCPHHFLTPGNLELISFGMPGDREKPVRC